MTCQESCKNIKKKEGTGNELFSHNVLSSPRWCLTSVFGMGTGVSIMLSLPDSSCQVSSGHSKPDSSFSSFKLACLFGQALDLLVSVRLTCHHAYTPDLSTLSSLRGLTCLRNGKSHLEVGFTLRCLQRLSLPHLATQLCHWRDNWSTIDASIPVLSYWGQLFSNFLRPRQIGTELSHDVLNPARVPL